MGFEPRLRTDILSEDITTEPDRIRVIAETQYNYVLTSADPGKSRTPGLSKDVIEVMELIQDAIEDYYRRTAVNKDAQVRLVYEYPDVNMELESISLCLEDRQPGMYSQGTPDRPGTVKNLRPIIRETVDDPDNPGYKRAILGYFYDNTLRLTCWARTNKAANDRALWLENVMEEYTWFFRYSGVNRIFYQGRGREIIREFHNNKIYGRPIDYYVRTEKLRVMSQKTMEEILIHMAVPPQETT